MRFFSKVAVSQPAESPAYAYKYKGRQAFIVAGTPAGPHATSPATPHPSQRRMT